MTPVTFTVPFEMFLYFLTTGLVFAMFVHFAVVFVSGIRFVKYITHFFDV